VIPFDLITSVALPNETLWNLEPHTAAKHKILACYLDAWFPILATNNTRIVYLDGFSGPGRYLGGEPGSPIVALRSALAHTTRLTSEVVFFFIEEKPDRANHLQREIARLKLPSNFRVTVDRGEFAGKFGETLDAIERNGLTMVPTFALIDPFGFSGLPYILIKRLLSHPKCEVLITFMVDSINRWLTLSNETITSYIAETFGSEDAVRMARLPDRINSLKQLYFQQLKKIARFVRYFEMRDKDNRIVYYLFFASNNALGHLRMKEAMWRVDPQGEFAFSDATDPSQTVLFENPHAKDLAEQITSRFKGTSKLAVSRIERFVNDETAYLRKHMTKALKYLEANSTMTAEPLKSDGKKRLSGTFSNEVLVTIKSPKQSSLFIRLQ
jgi:three-Cys-motif partner protein